eukprot:COSAG01_NODE_47821_length_386_cov_2.675958_1_plen_71_part_01
MSQTVAPLDGQNTPRAPLSQTGPSLRPFWGVQAEERAQLAAAEEAARLAAAAEAARIQAEAEAEARRLAEI